MKNSLFLSSKEAETILYALYDRESRLNVKLELLEESNPEYSDFYSRLSSDYQHQLVMIKQLVHKLVELI